MKGIPPMSTIAIKIARLLELAHDIVPKDYLLLCEAAYTLSRSSKPTSYKGCDYSLLRDEDVQLIRVYPDGSCYGIASFGSFADSQVPEVFASLCVYVP
jgi:hypothetical protein